VLQESRSYEIRIRPFNRGFTGLLTFLLLKGGMLLLRAGSARWKNKSVFIVDSSWVSTHCMLPALDALNTTTVSPWIWLSLETSSDRDKSLSGLSGLARVGSGA